MSNDPYSLNFIIVQELKQCGLVAIVLWSVEQSSSRMVLSCSPHPAVLFRVCPRNQSLLQEQPLSPHPHASAPYPFFISFSLAFFL